MTTGSGDFGEGDYARGNDGRGQVLGFSTDDEPYVQQDTQARIQKIVEGIAAEVGGQNDARAARLRLEDAIRAAGIPEQPEKWVSDTAGEIAAGRVVVIDRRIDAHKLADAEHDSKPRDRQALTTEGDIGSGKG